MSVTTTIPSSIEVSGTDVVSPGVDLAPAVPPDGAVTSLASVTLVDRTTGKQIPLPTPALVGTVVTVTLTGADLQLGHWYVLRIVFNCGSMAITTTTQVTRVP